MRGCAHGRNRKYPEDPQPLAIGPQYPLLHGSSTPRTYRTISEIKLGIIDLKLAVRGNPTRLDRAQVGSDNLCGRIPKSQNLSEPVPPGTQRRSAAHSSAISIAQMPVPVPISRIRWGFLRGARCSLRLRSIKSPFDPSVSYTSIPPHPTVPTSCCISSLNSPRNQQLRRSQLSRSLPILLLLVRGKRVLVDSEIGMVAPAVLEDVFVD